MEPAKPCGDVLAANAEQGKSGMPTRLARRAVLDRDFGVAVVVASDRPLEAKIKKRRMFDNEPPYGSRILGA